MALTSDSEELERRPTGRLGVNSWFATEPSAVIVQPTTLCNLNCVYCYLPERMKKQDMSVAIASAIADGIPERWPSSGVLEVVWHGGEPLTVGPLGLAGLMEPFEPLRRTGRIRQVVQTNATLITDEWCDLFATLDVAIGVSIDGPSEATAGRVDWRGRPAYDRIIRGIEVLKRRDLAFTVIAVIGAEQIDYAEDILNFLSELGCSYVGFNIEELEGINTHAGTPTSEQARRFWRDTIEWSNNNPHMGIREVDDLLDFLSLDKSDRNSDSKHDLLPTVAWNGDVVLLSPELAGTVAPEYANFIAGNVLTETLDVIINRAHDLRYVREFEAGIQNCKATCEFFAICQGSHACNRYFEHRSFLATETEHCKTSTQALVLALSDLSGTATRNIESEGTSLT